MIEPITMLATAGTIINLCGRLIENIYTLSNRISTMDARLSTLNVEINNLYRILTALEESFKSDAIIARMQATETGHERAHWDNVRTSLDDCHRTLRCLETIFDNLLNKRGGKLIHDVIKWLHERSNQDRIDLIKTEIRSYYQTLELSLSFITLYCLSRFTLG